ncbi:hypothetical protein DL93DRAFT_2079376, partial [Clavulina sp. PMI_390]
MSANFSHKAVFSPQFFMSQAVAIMEDQVIDLIDWVWRIGGFGKPGKAEDLLGAKEKYPPAVATSGYVWVFVWFCATVPQYQHGIL